MSGVRSEIAHPLRPGPEFPRIALRPSVSLAVSLAALHALALSAALLSLDGWALGLVVPGVLIAGAVTVREALLRRPGAIVELVLNANGAVHWRERCGRWRAGAATSGGNGTSLLIVMSLSETGARERYLVVPRDALDARDFRSLRRWLRRPERGFNIHTVQ